MMIKMQKFIRDRSGATAIEYALVAALIALAIMLGAGSLGTTLNSHYVYVAGKMKTS